MINWNKLDGLCPEEKLILIGDSIDNLAKCRSEIMIHDSIDLIKLNRLREER